MSVLSPANFCAFLCHPDVFIQHLCYLGQNTEKAFVDGEFVSLA
jgi:hypothetical protein